MMVATWRMVRVRMVVMMVTSMITTMKIMTVAIVMVMLDVGDGDGHSDGDGDDGFRLAAMLMTSYGLCVVCSLGFQGSNEAQAEC